jgi:hypothetical protein
MRSDSALARLFNEELCILERQDGNRYEVRWSQLDWCFYYIVGIKPAVACHFDDIQEWWPASTKF